MLVTGHLRCFGLTLGWSHVFELAKNKMVLVSEMNLLGWGDVEMEKVFIGLGGGAGSGV